MAKMKRVEGGVVKERWDSSQRNTPTKTGSVSAAGSPARPSQPSTTNSSFTSANPPLSQLLTLQKTEPGLYDSNPSTVPLSQQSTASPTLSPSPLAKTRSNSGSLTSFLSTKPESPLHMPSLSSKLSERPSSSLSRKRKSPAPAIETSRKRRSTAIDLPTASPRTPSRRTGRGSIAPDASEKRSANISTIRFLMTEGGLRMSASNADHDVIGRNRTSNDLTFATGLGVFTPFQELVSAFILNAHSNAYADGCSRIRRLFNEPYNLRTPSDIVSIGSKTLAAALKDDHTSQRNLSTKIYDLSSKIAESYANDTTLSFLRSEISADDPDEDSRESEPTHTETDIKKAISALLVPCNDQTAYFFVRRIQYTWPEFYATYDTWVTLQYVSNSGFPIGGVGELTDLIDEEWGAIKNAVKSASQSNEYGWQQSGEKDRKRECFVKVIDRIFGAGKNGALMDLLNESRKT